VRKAISFSGQSRFVKEGYETLKRNLVDFESYDVFVHTWTQGPLNQDVLKLYKPKSYCIEPQKHVVPALVKEYTESAFTHFSMFYTMMESLMLKSHYEKCTLDKEFTNNLSRYVTFAVQQGWVKLDNWKRWVVQFNRLKLLI
jgi:hypothetical protein